MKNWLVTLAFISVCFFWGSTYLAIKIGIQYFPPFTFSGVRFIVAGLIMVIYALFKGYSFPKSFKEFLPIAIVGTFMLTGGNGLVTIAELKVSSSIASLFIALVPLYIALIGSVLYKNERLSILGYVGLVVGFIGVYILVNPMSGSQLISFDGTILLLLAGFLWSFGSVYSKRINKDIHIISNIGLQMISGGVLLIIFAVLKGESFTNEFNINGIYSLLYLIIFGSIVGYSSYIYVLRKWPVAKAGTYAYVNPAVAIVLGYFILDETINMYMLLSMVLILFSVFLVQVSKTKV